MFKNIDEAIAWIVEQRNDNSTFEHFKDVCNSIGNPQNDFYTIHVAGTDGKGSTVTFIRDLLMSQGYKVGTLQSPHYLIHQDRIRVDNVNITDEAFLRILNDKYDFFMANNLSMFEMDYLIMCQYFKECNIDFAVVEVGLGGRLDSTNVIDNTKLSIITTIGYDHMDRLGNTLEKICAEKCGIIKDNSKVLIGKLNDNLQTQVKQCAELYHCQFYQIDEYEDLGDRQFLLNGEVYKLTSYAKYQLHNAALSLKAFDIISKDYGFKIDLEKAKMALSKTVWPCRFELVCEKPNIILDGGHNIHGVTALCESIDTLSGSKCVIFSALKRKEYNKMIEMLDRHCDELIITQFAYPGVIDLKDFKNYHCEEDFCKAIDDAKPKYDNIIICGSLYFLSDVVHKYKFLYY